MKRIGYQAVGFGVWQGLKWYLGRRSVGDPRTFAMGGLAVAALAGLVLAGRRATS